MKKDIITIVEKLSKERFELFCKVKKLEEFRYSTDWNKLSLNNKYLLDIQLQSMRTYMECLNARISNILYEED